MKRAASGRNWTRNELIMAFNLYCKIPFGRIHRHNPLIIELAKAIGRTPSAMSWKLANFARLDPTLQKRKIVGATHGAHAEVEVWNEFSDDWDQLAFESERLLNEMKVGQAANEKEPCEFPEGRSRETLTRVRVNQGFFRATVLAAYNGKCCITGLSVPQLLTASHIVPWSVDVKNRANPQNGLCLNAIHDRAFDCGLLTITPNLKIRVSPQMAKNAQDKAARDVFERYDGASISLPRRFVPHAEFLRYHNDKVFLGTRI